MPSTIASARALVAGRQKARRRRPAAAGSREPPAAAIARWANGSASAVRRNLSRISARSSARSGASRPLAGIWSISPAPASRSPRSPAAQAVTSGARNSRLPLSPWRRARARRAPAGCGAARRRRAAAGHRWSAWPAAPACARRSARSIWPAPIASLSALRARSAWSGCASASLASSCRGPRVIAGHRCGARLEIGPAPARAVGAGPRPAARHASTAPPRGRRRAIYMFG